jgi:hypothetical protein
VLLPSSFSLDALAYSGEEIGLALHEFYRQRAFCIVISNVIDSRAHWIPAFKTDRSTLYFFPDRLLVYNWGGVGAVPYNQLQAKATQIQFREDEQIPGDAVQIGTTRRFVNKNGGPDRRFNNNRQLPIMLYGQLFLTSTSGVQELFEMSVPAAAQAAADAISHLANGSL